jgi:hypothetical protein
VPNSAIILNKELFQSINRAETVCSALAASAGLSNAIVLRSHAVPNSAIILNKELFQSVNRAETSARV